MQESEADVLLGINFSPFMTEYLKLVKIFQIVQVGKAQVLKHVF